MNHYKNLVLPIVKKYVPDCTIYLYGSRARDDCKSGSDIDIALDDTKKISLLTMSLLKEAFEESNIPVNVDVVDVHAISDAFKKEIQHDWIIWKN